MSLNLLKAFKERGFEQLAITSTWTDGKFSKCLADEGIREIALPLGTFSKRLSLQAMSWTLNSLFKAPKLWIGLNRAFKQFQPDVLLLTNPKQGVWAYPWLKWQPSFLIEHSMKSVSSANRWMYLRLEERLSAFVAVSQFMRSHLFDLGVQDGNVRVIYNYCSKDSAPDHKPEKNRPIRIGIAGQVSPHKGFDSLLDATTVLSRRNIDFQVVVFGSGDEQYVSDLKARIESWGLTARWKWMGHTADRETIYRGMDLCVVPSRFDEPFGMAALEASAHGLPVIAARRGGLPEIVVDHETGFLVNTDDQETFADRIARFASNPRLLGEMGYRGQVRVLREFSQERTTTSYEALFCQSLAAHRKSRAG